MSPAPADGASPSGLLLYALGAVVLAAPLAYRVYYAVAVAVADSDLWSRARLLARGSPPPPPPRSGSCTSSRGERTTTSSASGSSSRPSTRPPSTTPSRTSGGDPGRTAGILCEGAEIRVTTNLFDALRRWRRADEDVVLWADAVCIDQRNAPEKAHQIALMADVYSRAASVLVWLGDDDAGLEGIEALVAAALAELPEVFPDDPARNRAGAGVEVAAPLDWAPLRSLLGHAWFERKWVFQEAVLNDETWLHCGRLRLPLGPVSHLALRMATFGVQPHPADTPLGPYSSAVYPLRLHNLAVMRASHWFRGRRPVTRAAKGPPGRRLPLVEAETLPAYTFRHGKFSAGGAEAGTIEVIGDKVLRCSRLVVDAVEDRGVFWYDTPLPPKPARVPHPLDKMDALSVRYVLLFLDYYRACVRLASPSGSEDVRDLAPGRLASPWKALTCERAQLSDRIDADLSEQFEAMVAGLGTWLTAGDPDEAEKARLSFVTSGLALETSIVGLGIPRRFSRTAEGRICMAPSEARVGDVICVLLGSEVPFVIRPTRRGMYEMIGEAHVSGIMDGEALSDKYDQLDIMLE
ncbi:hypothetical protein LX32DRAFT_714484 [Colletotrichum zoysiae]|uniref:Heterokaryon incompatibility domain-containing protein n=1 Tax=Colletotrichum zoysiae TaxID=1216348 RepID=A0AAD9H463_9PEZI|nr:hypothetical protein LX32DRAFT_714484 [Colletotrichum zoysiae]